MTVFAALAAGATIASGLPVVVGAAARGSTKRGVRLLWWWLTIGLIMNLVMASLAMRGLRTVGFALAALPLLGWLGIAALSRLAGRSWIASINGAGGACFTVWWLTCVMRQEYRSDFTAYSAPVLSFILTVAAVMLIVERFRFGHEQPLSDPEVLIGVAVLVTYAPMAALEPISLVLFKNNRELVQALWGARAVLLIGGSFLFAYALRRINSNPA